MLGRRGPKARSEWSDECIIDVCEDGYVWPLTRTGSCAASESDSGSLRLEGLANDSCARVMEEAQEQAKPHEIYESQSLICGATDVAMSLKHDLPAAIALEASRKRALKPTRQCYSASALLALRPYAADMSKRFTLPSEMFPRGRAVATSKPKSIEIPVVRAPDGCPLRILSASQSKSSTTSIPLRKWLDVPSTDATVAADQFSIMTWNALAPMYCTKEKFPHVDACDRDWNNRKQKVLDEVVYYASDVVCLQELTLEDFEGFFAPFLHARGYAGVFRAKVRVPLHTAESSATENSDIPSLADGCALFYNTTAFTLVSVDTFSYPDLASRMLPATRDVTLDVLRFPNTGIHVLLESRRSEGRRVRIVTTHLHWNPADERAKVLQAAILMSYLASGVNGTSSAAGSRKRQRGSRMAEEDGIADEHVPVVLAGDLNSLPGDRVMRFLESGSVDLSTSLADESTWDWSSRSYGPLSSATTSSQSTTPGIAMASGILTSTRRLTSAYASATLPYTNRTENFSGVIDHVLYDAKGLSVRGVLGPVAGNWLAGLRSLPSASVPSDHLPLGVKLVWRDGKGKAAFNHIGGWAGIRKEIFKEGSAAVNLLVMLLEASRKRKDTTLALSVYDRLTGLPAVSPDALDRARTIMTVLFLEVGRTLEGQNLLDAVENDDKAFHVHACVMDELMRRNQVAAAATVMPGYLRVLDRMPVSRSRKRAGYKRALSVFAAKGDLAGVTGAVRSIAEHGRLDPKAVASVVSTLVSRARTPQSAVTLAVVLEDIAARGWLRGVPVSNVVMGFMARHGLAHKAEAILNMLLDMGLRPDVHSFTCLVSAYANAGDHKAAQARFDMMKDHGLKPDSAAYTALMQSHRRGGDLKGVRTCFDNMIAAGVPPDVFTFTIMMEVSVEESMTTKKQDAAAACDALWTDMDRRSVYPNVRTWTALIRSDPTRAVDRFEQMQQARVTPDAHCFAAVMNACVSIGDQGAAERLYARMTAQRIKPTTVVFNVLLKAALIDGNADASIRLYVEMRRAGIKGDDSTLFLLVDCVGKHAEGMDFAEKTFREATITSSQRGSPPPTQDVHHALMNGYARRGHVEACLATRDALLRSGHSDDRVTRNIVLHAHARAGDWTCVKGLWTEMIETGQAGQDTVAHVLDSAGRNGTGLDVREVARRCKELGWEMEENACNSYIEALCRVGDCEAAIEVLFDMLGRGVEPTEKTFWTIVTPLMKRKMRKDVERVIGFLQRHYPECVPIKWADKASSL
ncbi:Glucose-repressible alcohol dehydrogenase transcriptional effector [Thoreauomyces humboldtii]|nr:Glucose-repressible alcohol dehydrogenase transcriptional effector [Thoreauomyces humboldtii]